MVIDPVLQILTYPRLTAGRRRLALERAHEALQGVPDTGDLQALVQGAQHANNDAVHHWHVWETIPRRRLHSAAAVGLDRQLDRTIGGLVRSVGALARAFPARSESGEHAQRLLDRAFPGGARAITNLPFVDQAHAIGGVLDLLQGELAESVAHLGVGLLVERTAELHVAYLAALSEPRLTYDDVRKTEQRAYEAWLRVIAGILGLAAGGQPERVKAAAAAMKHLEEQRREHARYRKRRRGPPAKPASPETEDPEPG